jgi:hypothetical protein
VPNRKTYIHKDHGFDFKPLKCVTTDQGRYYITPDDYKYYSVTTVTGFEKTAFFAEWRRKNPDESKRVTRRGNYLHSLVEDYINNKELQPSGEEVLLFEQMLPMLHKIDNIYAQEVSLYSKLLGLAGRVDCVAEYDGVLSIIDFKGSTRHKRESDIQNYFQQATAYAIMWKELTGQSIEQIVILISSEDGSTQELIRNPIDYVSNLKGTIDRFRQFNAAKVTSSV